MKKKILGLFISAIMAVSFAPGSVRAEGDDIGEHGMGIIPDDHDYGEPKSRRSEQPGFIRSSNLPSKYDGRTEGLVTSVKDQKQFGNCWAFTNNATLESALIKDGLADNSIDLSELHTIYFMYNENEDPTGRMTGDRNYISLDVAGNPCKDFTVLADSGGSLHYTSWQMLNGAIPFEENGDDYVTAAKNKNYTIDQSKCFTKDYRVEGIYRSDFDIDHVDYIKSLVYEHGGVGASFYCDQTKNEGTSDSKYFKVIDGTKTFYYPNSEEKYSSHGVEIVGWDDNYPVENFNYAPPGKGAWLVKNSWGTNSKNDGFLWLSYYCSGKSAHAVAYDLCATNPNEYIYQYDGGDCCDGVYPKAENTKDMYMLSFFTADGTNGDGREVIRKIGVGAPANSEFTISIMMYEPKVVNHTLLDYVEQCVTECKSTYDGYQEYELSKPAEFVNGERFAVCIKVKAGSGIYRTYSYTPSKAGTYGTVEKIQDDTLYYGYGLNGLYSVDNGSFVVKAISETENYKDVTGITLDQDNLMLNFGDPDNSSAELTATLTPDNAYPEIKWTSSDPNVAIVSYTGNGDKATVTAVGEGDCVLTATSHNKNIYATCDVSVYFADQTDAIVKTRKSKDLLWTIDKNGKLYIKGKGDYENEYEIQGDDGKAYMVAPWIEYADQITSAVVSVDGLTYADKMFYNCNNLTVINMPAGMNVAVDLPAVDGFCWKDDEGTEYTETQIGTANPVRYHRQSDDCKHPKLSENHFDRVEAGCKTYGNVEYYLCPDCGDMFADAEGKNYLSKDDVIINPNGHKGTEIPKVLATCTKCGFSAGVKCWVCKEILVEPVETPPLGHLWHIEDYRAATCKFEGRSFSRCSRCGEEEDKVLPKTDHIEVIDYAIDPTETKTGLTAGKHCLVCGTILVKQQVIPKLTPKKKQEAKNYSNEWVDGKWYDANGNQTYSGRLMWACNSTGWWVEDTSGWYPISSWQKIDGVWYYFKADGYMASSEYCCGYWFNSDGSWDSRYLLSWKCNSSGWWVEDISGWWPSNSWLKIDNCWYYFDSSGYMVTNRYVDGYWIGADGVCY